MTQLEVMETFGEIFLWLLILFEPSPKSNANFRSIFIHTCLLTNTVSTKEECKEI